MGIGDWGLGIGDWGFGPKPKTPTPKPKTQEFYNLFLLNKFKKKKIFYYLF